MSAPKRKNFYDSEDMTEISKRIRESTQEQLQSYIHDDSGSSITTTAFSDHPFFIEDDLLPWTYENVAASAPMVRISHLPFRLTCKNYGCDMVYSEELIAKKLSTCTRVVKNGLIMYLERSDAYLQQLYTDIEDRSQRLQKPVTEDELEYIMSQHFTPGSDIMSSVPVLATYPHERLVLQMGVSNGIDAIQAANVVERDVRAFDINMGCPKFFSLQGAMGSALLTMPEAVDDIIRNLKKNTNRPITAKIRMLPDIRETVELVQRLTSLGVSAIGVHCRMKQDRPRYKAAPILQMPILCSSTHVPLLYNGDICMWNEIDRYRQITGASSVLIGRGAIYNPSVFGSYVDRLQCIQEIYTSTLHANPVLSEYMHTRLEKAPKESYIPNANKLKPLQEIMNTNATPSSSTESSSELSSCVHAIAHDGSVYSKEDAYKKYTELCASNTPFHATVPVNEFEWKWSDEEAYLQDCDIRNPDRKYVHQNMRSVLDTVVTATCFSRSLGNCYSNTKYVVSDMLQQHAKVTKSEAWSELHRGKTYDTLFNCLEQFTGNPVLTAEKYIHPYPPDRWVLRATDVKYWGKSKRQQLERKMLEVVEPSQQQQQQQQPTTTDEEKQTNEQVVTNTNTNSTEDQNKSM